MTEENKPRMTVFENHEEDTKQQECPEPNPLKDPDSESIADKDKDIDLHFISLFDKWCTRYSQLVAEMDGKNTHIKPMEKTIETTQMANRRLQEECEQLRKTLDQCQAQTQILCELEDEVRNLKSQLAEKEEELTATRLQSKLDTKSLKDRLLEEHKDNEAKLNSEHEKKVGRLETLLQEEKDSRAAMETSLNQTVREKDREISRITIEYEGKLAQAERQRAHYVQQKQQIMNQDILRKKMHHMKETYEQELASLRSQISDMSREAGRSSSVPHTTAAGDSRQGEQHCTPGASGGELPGNPGSRPRGKIFRNLSVSKRSF